MRAFTKMFNQSLAMVLVAMGGFTAAQAATMYTSQQLGQRPQYAKLNNNTFVLTELQDSAALSDLHIVIENWSNGGRNYSEFRPGTLPGTTRSIGGAFNDVQAITGYAETADANGNIYAADGYTPLLPPRAFVYSNGAFTDLSLLPPLNTATTSASIGKAINNRGDVAGYWSDASGTHAFIYTHVDTQGAITPLGSLGGSNPDSTIAKAINNLGQVVGDSRISNSQFPHTFLYDHGAFTDLGLLPGWEWHDTVDINDRGEVIGTMHAGNHSVGCFIYSGGVLNNIGNSVPGSNDYCQISKINNSGVAVGFTNVANPQPPDFLTVAPFVYSNGQMTNLNTLISPSDYLARNNIKIRNAVAINDKGEIIATTYESGPITYYLLTPVTEPPATDTAYYNFEQTTHDWYNSGDDIVTVADSTTQKFAGAASLAVQFKGSGYVSVGAMYPPQLAGKTVTFRVYLPADANIEWVQPFILEDYAGNWAWHGNWQPASDLQLGAWNTITVEVPASAQPIYRIGVELYTSQPYNGTVYIDSVSF